MNNKEQERSIMIFVIILASLFYIGSLWAQDQDNEGQEFFLNEHVEASYALSASLPEFVSSLDRMKAPTRYIKEALNHLNGIGFKSFPEGVIAYYNKLTNWIYLGESLKDPATGGLKPLSQLTPDDISTVYHELWHCYLSRVAKPRSDELALHFRENAYATYPDHQLDFQDEAYAAFIDTSIVNYIQIRKSMERLGPEKREMVRLQVGKGLSGLFEASFWDHLYGYYRSWTGKFITTTIDLPKADRKIIASLLFDSQLPMVFAEAYAENKF
jgi:hypothetical protein